MMIHEFGRKVIMRNPALPFLLYETLGLEIHYETILPC